MAPTRPYKYEDPCLQMERLRHRAGRSFVQGLGTESNRSGMIELEPFPRAVLPAPRKHGDQAHLSPSCPVLLLSGRWTVTRKRGSFEGGQDSEKGWESLAPPTAGVLTGDSFTPWRQKTHHHVHYVCSLEKPHGRQSRIHPLSL